MASINLMGSYSGIDMATVDQLIAAESGKKVQYTSKKTELTEEKNAWKDVNTRLDSLYKKFETMTEVGTYDSKKVSNSKEDIASVSANESAIPGTYYLNVEQLATSSQLTSGKIAKLAEEEATVESELGLSGQLKLTNDEGTAVEINIEEGDSLKDIVNKFNETSGEEKSGLQATIIDERLVILDSNMGARNITVEGKEEVLTALSLNAPAAGETNDSFSSIKQGQPARFSVNGIVIERDSNTITDAVEGLTLTLQSVSKTESTSTIKVENDLKKTTDAVQAFVDQYNSVMTFIDDQLDVGDPSAEDNKTGALVGDSSLMRLQSQLRSLLTSVSRDETAPIRSLKELGIEVDRDGQASLDTGVLEEKLAEDANAVQRFFFQEVPEVDEAGEETGETVEVGVAKSMMDLINDYISEDTGLITVKSKSIDNMMKDIDKQIEVFDQRLERKRERYIKQFSALDTAMMQAESQLNYMLSQVSTWSGNSGQ